MPIKIPEVTFVAAPRGGVDGAAVIDRLIARYTANSQVVPERTNIGGTPFEYAVSRSREIQLTVFLRIK